MGTRESSPPSHLDLNIGIPPMKVDDRLLDDDDDDDDDGSG